MFCHLLRRSNNVCFTSFLSFVQFWPNFSNSFFFSAELPVVLATVEQKLIELTTLTNLEGKCDFSYVTFSAILNFIFASKFFRIYSLKKSGILAQKFKKITSTFTIRFLARKFKYVNSCQRTKTLLGVKIQTLSDDMRLRKWM